MPNKATIPYFAYGMNLDIEAMIVRCPGCIPRYRATLMNYRLVFRGVASIEYAVGYRVHGAFYLLYKENLTALDRLEGYPSFYTRRIMPIQTICKPYRTEAWAYIMNTECRPYSPPSIGYLRTIVNGCHLWGIPEHYENELIQTAGR